MKNLIQNKRQTNIFKICKAKNKECSRCSWSYTNTQIRSESSHPGASALDVVLADGFSFLVLMFVILIPPPTSWPVTSVVLNKSKGGGDCLTGGGVRLQTIRSSRGLTPLSMSPLSSSWPISPLPLPLLRPFPPRIRPRPPLPRPRPRGPFPPGEQTSGQRGSRTQRSLGSARTRHQPLPLGFL